MPSTVFTPVAQGGANFNPLTSFNYRPVGVNIQVTPRVTFEGDIILDLLVESSTLGQDINIAGQNLPSFGSQEGADAAAAARRRVEPARRPPARGRAASRCSGIPGLLRLPVLRSLLASNDSEITQTDIIMLLTPRIVRTQELTLADVSPIFIGSQQSLGLGGPPPLIAAPAADATPEPPAPAAPATRGRAAGRSWRDRGAAGQLADSGTTTLPAAPAQPVAGGPPGAGAAVPPGGQGATGAGAPPVAPPAAAAAPATGGQIMLTPPGPDFRVGAGPYTVPDLDHGRVAALQRER